MRTVLYLGQRNAFNHEAHEGHEEIFSLLDVKSILLHALRTTIVQRFPGLRKFASGECIYPERELTELCVLCGETLLCGFAALGPSWRSCLFVFWLRLGRAGRYGETLLCIAGYRAG
jgi:hypothetical protein